MNENYKVLKEMEKGDSRKVRRNDGSSDVTCKCG